MIQYEEPIGLKSYTICIDTKKITLYAPHLRKKARERIERGHPIHIMWNLRLIFLLKVAT